MPDKPVVTLVRLIDEPKSTHRNTWLHGYSHREGTPIDVEVDGVIALCRIVATELRGIVVERV